MSTPAKDDAGRSAWRVDRHPDGYVIVTFDCPGQSVNTFSRRVLEELDELLDRLANTDTDAVFFRSGKPGNFAAGADLHEVATIRDSAEAVKLSGFGQQVFRKVERLPVTTVALVSGVCLGGGLEFALACDYVVADDDPRTLLGFPEVLIGLIPGWGGTVRARRRLGLIRAMAAVTAGSRYNGRQAKKLGLVDDVVPTEALLDAARWFARHRPKRKRPVLRRLTDNRWVGTWIIKRFRSRVLSLTRGHYPAPLKALAVFQAGLEGGVSKQYAAEREAIGELASHPVTPQLMRIFFLQEQAKDEAKEAVQEPPTLKRVGVVGAGLMGSGIAALLAQRGIEVRLKDLRPDLIANALQRIRKHLRKQVRQGRLTEKQARETLQRIYPTTDYTGFKHLELVIEAVLEDETVKRDVYRQLFDRLGADGVVATNTSSFSLAQLAGGEVDRGRFLALHFFNPPHRMRLVEVAWTPETSQQAKAAAIGLALQLGKTPVLVGDCPGFVVNRLLTPYLNQVGYLLPWAPDPLELEEAMKAFGFPMGPLELLDLVGLPVAQKVATNLHQSYGERMKPAPLFSSMEEATAGRARPVKLIEERGWFRKRREVAPELRRALALARRNQAQPVGQWPSTPESLAQVAVAPLLNEAVLMVQEGLVSSPDMIDLAMILGTGFPPFRGGPVAYGDQLGWDRVLELLEQIRRWRPEVQPCELLRDLARTGRRLSTGREAVATTTEAASENVGKDETIPLSGEGPPTS